jgi:hypothetical protein
MPGRQLARRGIAIELSAAGTGHARDERVKACNRYAKVAGPARSCSVIALNLMALWGVTKMF